MYICASQSLRVAICVRDRIFLNLIPLLLFAGIFMYYVVYAHALFKNEVEGLGLVQPKLPCKKGKWC